MNNELFSIMIEHLIMILVFALSAAFCIKIILVSDRVSQESADRDMAVILVQNAAERLSSGQDIESCFYDADGNMADSGYVYELSIASLPSGNRNLEEFAISVLDAKSNILFEIVLDRQVTGDE